jgi:pimeloyl-ACP methyl ester carboxylesterase
MCDARLWRHQVAEAGYPTWVPEWPMTDNFRDMAASVLERAPPTFAMAGLSMGGILAFEIWRQAPHRVTHLALLDTNPHADTPQRTSMRVQQVEEVVSGRLREVAIESLKPMYLAAANRGNKVLLDTILAMALDLGPEVFRLHSLALMNRADSVPTLPTIDCPTSVICGREDALCPVEYHELMASRIPNARMTVIDDCGHLSSLEQPAAVTAELRRLIAR